MLAVPPTLFDSAVTLDTGCVSFMARARRSVYFCGDLYPQAGVTFGSEAEVFATRMAGFGLDLDRVGPDTRFGPLIEDASRRMTRKRALELLGGGRNPAYVLVPAGWGWPGKPVYASRLFTLYRLA